MEKVHLLINRLKEQLDQQASNDSLLITAQMLVIELQEKHLQQPSGKVAVTMPYRQHQDYVAPTAEAKIVEIPCTYFAPFQSSLYWSFVKSIIGL